MRIFQTVKKIISGGGGGNGFIAGVVRAGIALSTRFTLLAGELKSGIAISQSPTTQRGAEMKPGIAMTDLGATGGFVADAKPGIAMTPAPSNLSPASSLMAPGLAMVQSLRSALLEAVRPGIAMSDIGATGEAEKPPMTPGLAMSTVINSMNTPATPGFDIKAIICTGTRRVGGNAVVETAVGGRTDWANDANAISGTDGIHDGSNATLTGNALGARGGQLELSYADHLSKDKLRITSAKLHFYGQVSGTLANNADVALKWDDGRGTFLTLETITGDANFLTTPKTHDVTASFNSWTGHNNLRTAMSGNPAIAETWVAAFDACELELEFEYKYIEDLSASLKDGAVLGRVIPTIGAGPDYGIAFDGVDRNHASQGVLVGVASDQDFAVRGRSGDWTMDLRFKPTVAINNYVAGRFNNTGAGSDWLFQMLWGGGLALMRFNYTDAASALVALDTVQDIAVNDTVHIRVKKSGSTLSIEKNGVAGGSSSTAPHATPQNIESWLGRSSVFSYNTNGNPFPFTGTIYEFRLSDVARSDDWTLPYVADANTKALYRPTEILP